MRKFALAAAAFGLALTAAPAMADDHEKPEMEEFAADWYQINMIKFYSGKRARAGELLDNYLNKALEGTKVKPTEIHVNVGDYDIIMMWPMPAGPKQFGWAQNPYFAEAWENLKEVAGGEDERQAIIDEFDSLIQEEKEMLAHIDKDEAE